MPARAEQSNLRKVQEPKRVKPAGCQQLLARRGLFLLAGACLERLAVTGTHHRPSRSKRPGCISLTERGRYSAQALGLGQSFRVGWGQPRYQL